MLVVSGLDPNYDIGMLFGQSRALLRLEIAFLLLSDIGSHAQPSDIDKRQHARPRAFDYRMTKGLEISPAVAARIHHSRDAATEAEVIRPDAVVAGPRIANT